MRAMMARVSPQSAGTPQLTGSLGFGSMQIGIAFSGPYVSSIHAVISSKLSAV